MAGLGGGGDGCTWFAALHPHDIVQAGGTGRKDVRHSVFASLYILMWRLGWSQELDAYTLMQSAMYQLETRQVDGVQGCCTGVGVNQTRGAATTCLLHALIELSPKLACGFHHTTVLHLSSTHTSTRGEQRQSTRSCSSTERCVHAQPRISSSCVLLQVPS